MPRAWILRPGTTPLRGTHPFGRVAQPVWGSGNSLPARRETGRLVVQIEICDLTRDPRAEVGQGLKALGVTQEARPDRRVLAVHDALVGWGPGQVRQGGEHGLQELLLLRSDGDFPQSTRSWRRTFCGYLIQNSRPTRVP